VIPSIDVSTTVDKPGILFTRTSKDLARVLDTERSVTMWLRSIFNSHPTAAQAFTLGAVRRTAVKRIGSSNRYGVSLSQCHLPIVHLNMYASTLSSCLTHRHQRRYRNSTS